MAHTPAEYSGHPELIIPEVKSGAFRYFIELSYNGTGLAGFQRQPNAVTVQQLLEEALFTLTRRRVELTGSSRTDAGVHAYHNYFHFDDDQPFDQGKVYRLNALLPPQIAILSIRQVDAEAHCRFHAQSRYYVYRIHQQKNPFQHNRSWFFPFQLQMALLQQTANVIKETSDFTSFCKRNAQVHTHICHIQESYWEIQKTQLQYHVKANRFLRGMVRALVATQLKIARGTWTLKDLTRIIEARDCTEADFSAPAKGLYLKMVDYPVEIWKK